MKIFLLFIVSLLSVSSFAQKKSPCDTMRAGTFKYIGGDDTTAVVVIDGDKHMEFHNNSAYHIASDIKWINNCTFELTMTEITIPNFPFGPGDKMKVEIQKVNGDLINFRATVNGQSWGGLFQKIR